MRARTGMQSGNIWLRTINLSLTIEEMGKGQEEEQGKDNLYGALASLSLMDAGILFTFLILPCGIKCQAGVWWKKKGVHTWSCLHCSYEVLTGAAWVCWVARVLTTGHAFVRPGLPRPAHRRCEVHIETCLMMTYVCSFATKSDVSTVCSTVSKSHSGRRSMQHVSAGSQRSYNNRARICTSWAACSCAIKEWAIS